MDRRLGWGGTRARVDAVAVKSLPRPCRESNPGRPTRSLTTTLSELTRRYIRVKCKCDWTVLGVVGLRMYANCCRLIYVTFTDFSKRAISLLHTAFVNGLHGCCQLTDWLTNSGRYSCRYPSAVVKRTKITFSRIKVAHSPEPSAVWSLCCGTTFVAVFPSATQLAACSLQTNAQQRSRGKVLRAFWNVVPHLILPEWYTWQWYFVEGLNSKWNPPAPVPCQVFLLYVYVSPLFRPNLLLTSFFSNAFYLRSSQRTKPG
jgi:hypothetical protein